MGLLDNSHHNSKPARLPALPSVPRGVDPAMHQLLEAIKERLEVREGSRGNQFEKVVTERRLLDFIGSAEFKDAVGKYVFGSSYSTKSSLASGSQATLDVSVRKILNSMGVSTSASPGDAALSAVRAEMLRHISEIKSQGGITLEQVMALTPKRYSTDDLAADLADGAATIIAGAASGTTLMELDPAGNYVLFKHKDSNVGGTVGAYSGMVRTAVGVTAAGFLAGFNRQSDGAWQSSIVIDSATGNVTILGTLKANSVIEVGALVGAGGQTIGTVASNAITALSGLSDKLNKAGGDILSGAITFNSAGGFRTSGISIDTNGSSSGTGVAITSAGIVGRNTSGITFAIDTNGNATFKGDITGASGTFAGNLSTNGYVKANGQISSADGIASIVGNESGVAGKGVVGYAGNTTLGSGIYGVSPSVSAFMSAGVTGLGRAGNPAVWGRSFDGSPGVRCDNAFIWNGYTIAAPSNSTTTFLRNDGQWAAPAVDWSGITGKPSTFAPATHGHFLSDIQPNNFDTPSFQFSTDGGATWTGILLKRL